MQYLSIIGLQSIRNSQKRCYITERIVQNIIFFYILLISGFSKTIQITDTLGLSHHKSLI